MKSRLALVLCLLLPIAACDGEHGVDTATIASADPAEWPSYGRDYTEDRYSPLDQINTGNVDKLGLAWYYEFDTDRGQQATPLVVDGVLYTTTAWSEVHAFDAKTGKPLWSYDPQVDRGILVKACCDSVNRGVALWGGKVFVGALDGRLIALDAKTGQEVWTAVTVDQTKDYTITGAPRVAKGKVLIGNGGAEYAVRGYVSAYDADTGKLDWRFYTVPNPDFAPDNAASDKALAEIANKTWFGDGWKMGGGGTAWDAILYDPETDLVYIGAGNGGPQNHVIRSDGKGDNLFLSSIIAVRADTGEYVWHYQTTPGDTWDYTATQSMTLADLNIDGKMRKVIMQAPKNGFFYVLDRVTGELLSADPYTDVNWATGVDMKTGRPMEVEGARYLDKPFAQIPGPLGGHGPQPWAFDPKQGLMYIPVQRLGMTFNRDTKSEYRPGHMYVGIDFKSGGMMPSADIIAQIKSQVWGELVAWDPVARERKWTVRNTFYHNSGVAATAGGLVFQGTAEGTFDAYNSATGDKLWSYETGNGIVSGPISYAVDGEQYVAVMAGYGGAGAGTWPLTVNKGRQPGRLFVFKLNGTAVATPYPDTTPGPIELGDASSDGDAAAGKVAYELYCSVCHGAGLVNRYNADLRRSAAARDPDVWHDIVVNGALSANGMASFSDVVSAEDAENIRAYVLATARATAEAMKAAEEQKAAPSP